MNTGGGGTLGGAVADIRGMRRGCGVLGGCT